MIYRYHILSGLGIFLAALAITGCAQEPAFVLAQTQEAVRTQTAEVRELSDTDITGPSTRNGFITGQILDGEDGAIHYSYYLPAGYDPAKEYPLMVAMPGYDAMWFGEQSLGKNLDWRGALVWTEEEEEMIVVSAQLTDWGEKSARQAIELTEYIIENFSVDSSRVYGTGYSAGGETMSRAVSMRPDLFAAYLHGASQWDGSFDTVAESGTAVYIFMAKNDEYYGSQKARNAYEGLAAAYRKAGRSEEQLEDILKLEIPEDFYFNSQGIRNYHSGGNILYEEERIRTWILSKKRF